jgi:hypothetical protein
MSKVYITNFAGHDHSSAERYGPFVYITRGNVNLASLDRIKLTIAASIIDSTADDWLLISGNSYVSLAAALIWQAKHKKVKLLIHDSRRRGEYREVVFSEHNTNAVLEVTQG